MSSSRLGARICDDADNDQMPDNIKGIEQDLFTPYTIKVTKLRATCTGYSQSTLKCLAVPIQSGYTPSFAIKRWIITLSGTAAITDYS